MACLSARRIVTIATALFGPILVIASANPAFGDGPNSGSEFTAGGIGDSAQYFEWSRSDKRVRLTNTTDENMSTAHCVDAFFDWQTAGGHYDVRILRNCKPNSYVQTDPSSAGGDGFWSEDWGPRDITGVAQVGGYTIDDGTLDKISGPTFRDFKYGSPPDDGDIPTTQGQRFARVRTLYQDGHRETTADNAAKYHCFDGNVPGTDICT